MFASVLYLPLELNRGGRRRMQKTKLDDKWWTSSRSVAISGQLAAKIVTVCENAFLIKEPKRAHRRSANFEWIWCAPIHFTLKRFRTLMMLDVSAEVDRSEWRMMPIDFGVCTNHRPGNVICTRCIRWSLLVRQSFNVLLLVCWCRQRRLFWQVLQIWQEQKREGGEKGKRARKMQGKREGEGDSCAFPSLVLVVCLKMRTSLSCKFGGVHDSNAIMRDNETEFDRCGSSGRQAQGKRRREHRHIHTHTHLYIIYVYIYDMPHLNKRTRTLCVCVCVCGAGQASGSGSRIKFIIKREHESGRWFFINLF